MFKFTRFYSRATFYLIFSLCITIFVLFSVINKLTNQYEKERYLKEYDITLNDVHRIFNDRNNRFPYALKPLFSSMSSYNDLCELLKTNNRYTMSSSALNNVVDILSNICYRDMDCVGILLYSNTTNNLYQFDTKFNTLKLIPLDGEIPSTESFQLNILSTDTIDQLSTQLYRPVTHMYGLVGTIFEQSSKQVDVLGQIIMLYSVSDLQTTIAKNVTDTNAVYGITDTKGNIIFQSNEASNIPPVNYSEFSIKNNINISSPKTYIHNNRSYFSSHIFNKQNGFYAYYIIPSNLGKMSYTQKLSAIFAVSLALLTIIYQVASYKITDRKIKIIENGMTIIGNNNFDYRIPLPKIQDEFRIIIEGFNRMCDELRNNVEKFYIYELAQKNTELYALQTSINPHFLYNTLELIRYQVQSDKSDEASQMILLLSKIYRNQIRRNVYVSIDEELDQCDNLMSLYTCRYCNFEYNFNIPTHLLRYGIPKNTFQPLIENYFVHGIDQNREDNYLEISGEEIILEGSTYIKLSIQDNGQSISFEELDNLKKKLEQSVFESVDSSGFALSNVSSRLKIVFGTNCGLVPGIPKNGQGFIVTITIPPVLPSQLNEL